MERLGRDAKVLLCGIFVVGIVASFMVFGISSMLIRSFQQKLILHDYAVAGYQINHENDLIIAAFTADKTLEDVVCGQEALDAIGYHIDVSPKWIPVILEYRNQTLLSLFLLLLFLFGTICLFLFWYLYRFPNHSLVIIPLHSDRCHVIFHTPTILIAATQQT